jgi:hypothetical protein
MFSNRNVIRIGFAMIGLAVFPLLVAAHKISEVNTPQARDYQLVRQLIDRFNDAYRSLNANALASLETDEFNLVDRFGEFHSAVGKLHREQIWAEGFNAIDKRSFAPVFKIQQIHFARPDVARVPLCAHYGTGIALLDGSRIAPLWETESFLVVKMRGIWLVTAVDVHDQTVPEGCAGGWLGR